MKNIFVAILWMLLLLLDLFQQAKGQHELLNPHRIDAHVYRFPEVPTHANDDATGRGFIFSSFWQLLLSRFLGVVPYVKKRAAFVTITPGVNPIIRGNLQLYNVFGTVLIKGEITGLSPGLHGFHVHQTGDLGNSCANAGGHFNPFGTNHGSPQSDVRHVGDLGNIEADANGRAIIYILDRHISLAANSQAFIGNRAIVVHSGADDLGLGGNSGSLATGNAGTRDGCGIIVLH